MTAKIIQFNSVVEPPQIVPPQIVQCSFCGLDTIKSLSSGDNKKHICPKCMVKCDNLMKGEKSED